VAPLSDLEVLDLWERGRAVPDADRALLILSVGDPGADGATLSALSIGARDAQLLALREATFGSTLASIARCPACACSVEVAIDTRQMRAASPDAPRLREISVADVTVQFRLPDSRDLQSIAGAPDIAAARRQLIARCITATNREGGPVDHDALPQGTIAEVVARMAEDDPQADISLSMTCPSCATAWDAPVDIADFLWHEIRARALRLLREVHVMASAYGWRESEILALTPLRREAYLELIAG
jgi:hypothetical protein